ncbi:hypothetical protein Gohar_022425 [Gossypium harknessii]|uniref:Uncharacterized protein n=1 Tax=Gossypium harknessii TaxID=34285 RepID=A0A7J9IE79_9ROSI|nr:hypothetical protein [Gossypium harknessii]
MKIPLQEQGFESISVLKKETREMIQFHRWEKLCTIPTDLVYILILHEFYVTLNETNANRPMNVPWMRILVQEKEISISTPEMATLLYVILKKERICVHGYIGVYASMDKEKGSGITFLALRGSLMQTNKAAKYEVKTELSKTKKEEESEGEDDLEEDPEEDLKGEPDKANEALEPDSD